MISAREPRTSENMSNFCHLKEELAARTFAWCKTALHAQALHALAYLCDLRDMSRKNSRLIFRETVWVGWGSWLRAKLLYLGFIKGPNWPKNYQ